MRRPRRPVEFGGRASIGLPLALLPGDRVRPSGECSRDMPRRAAPLRCRRGVARACDGTVRRSGDHVARPRQRAHRSGGRDGAHRSGPHRSCRPPAASPPCRAGDDRRSGRDPHLPRPHGPPPRAVAAAVPGGDPDHRALRRRRVVAPQGLPRRAGDGRRRHDLRGPAHHRDGASRPRVTARPAHPRRRRRRRVRAARRRSQRLLPRRHRPVPRDGRVGADRCRAAADLGVGADARRGASRSRSRCSGDGAHRTGTGGADPLGHVQPACSAPGPAAMDRRTAPPLP